MILNTVSQKAIIREMDVEELEGRYTVIAAKSGVPTSEEFDEVLLIARQYRQLTGFDIAAPYPLPLS